MQEKHFPWRTTESLSQVLSECRPFLEDRRIIETGAGSSETAISAAEKRMGRLLPPEVREFHLAVRPVQIFVDDRKHNFGFYQLEDAEFAWRSMREAVPAEDFVRAEGLAIGQGIYGDPFWWIEGHRSFRDGSIVIFDHEGNMGEIPFARFANDLADFIAKTTFFGGIDPPAGKEADAIEKRALFERDYHELNSV